MSDPCVCCGGETGPGLPGLLRCAACGHSRADIALGAGELRKLYGRGYYEGMEYADYALEAPALRRNFRARLGELARTHPKGAALFEIGCAYGFFLEAASDHFRVAGCDISEHAAQTARTRLNAPVTAGDYLDLTPPEPPEVVCLWDTVEHLADPAACLEKVFGDLRPGGTLMLSTGDMGALLPRLQGRRWRLIHPPTHLHYFTARSMRALLGRLGFTNITIRHHAFWRSADAVAFRLLAGPEGRLPALYRMLKGAGLLNFSFPVNTLDLMTVRAEKPRAAVDKAT